MRHMNFSRAWIVLSLAWAATSLLLAPVMADALMDNAFTNTAFFWCLLVSGVLIPLAHEFVHSQRPYRRAILAGAVLGAALFGFVLFEGRYTDDISWIPLAWACILGASDWLFSKAQLAVAAQPRPIGDVKARLRGYAENNTARAIEGFDTNVAEFKKVFLDEMPQGGSYVQFGSVSLIAVKDFLATKMALEAALAAFYIVFQRVYDDPRQSQAHSQLRRHVAKKISEIVLPDQMDPQPCLTDAEFQKVLGLVNNPKYLSKKDELRLAVAMVGLFVDMQLNPPLSEDKDREFLGQLMKRTLHRMRMCLQK
ncbi:hypothetical protein [Yoonia maritima]|uniref:hypothetical protein n=1 Tax=Yoonia maritima TaxID=1435347 RepID=UPI003734D6CD